MILLGYVWGAPDVLYLVHSTDRIGTSNDAHYSNDAFEELLKQGQQTLDLEQRLPIYHNAR